MQSRYYNHRLHYFRNLRSVELLKKWLLNYFALRHTRSRFPYYIVVSSKQDIVDVHNNPVHNFHPCRNTSGWDLFGDQAWHRKCRPSYGLLRNLRMRPWWWERWYCGTAFEAGGRQGLESEGKISVETWSKSACFYILPYGSDAGLMGGFCLI